MDQTQKKLEFCVKIRKEFLPNFLVNTHCPKLAFSRENTATTPSSGKPWALGTNVASSFPSLEMSQLASLWILQLGAITCESPESKISVNSSSENCHASNVVPRVLKLFGQQLVARNRKKGNQFALFHRRKKCRTQESLLATNRWP